MPASLCPVGLCRRAWYAAIVLRESRLVVLGLLTFAVAPGCGSSGDDGAPGAAGSGSPATAYQTPAGFCAGPISLSGGDLLGTWTVIDACAISANAPRDCPDASLTLALSAAGTVMFNADQTASIDVTLNLKKRFTPLLSCVAASDCAAFASTLQGDSSQIPGANVTCVLENNDASRCACEEDLPHVVSASGNYALQPPHYVTGAVLGMVNYSVQGNTLRLDGLTFAGVQLDLIARR